MLYYFYLLLIYSDSSVKDVQDEMEEDVEVLEGKPESDLKTKKKKRNRKKVSKIFFLSFYTVCRSCKIIGLTLSQTTNFRLL